MRKSIEDESNSTVMILHGEPGCGKSGLVAAVAAKCFQNVNKDDFLFVHAVDTCPGSTLLEKMLQKTQNLS